MPPLTPSAVLYGVPTVPLGRGLGEVIVRDELVGEELGEEVADAIVSPSDAEAVRPEESFTTKVKLLVPAFAGVPDKAPDGLKPRPVLQPPEHCVIDQVYGEVPPLAARVVP